MERPGSSTFYLRRRHKKKKTNKKLLLHNIRIVRLYTSGVYKSCSKINKINRSLHDIQILNRLEKIFIKIESNLNCSIVEFETSG